MPAEAETRARTAPRAGLGLIALNGVLLAALALVTLGPGAAAQNQAQNRAQNQVLNQSRRLMGEYTMVGGAAQGVTGNVVYVLDSANMQLIALRWDQTRRTVAGIGFRDLRADREASAGQR